jgi:dihydropteroate synthase
VEQVVIPQIMGILNVTPDSFSDGGHFLDPTAAVRRGRQMRAEGADWIDVGGESTRPGADPVAEAEELRRVLPVIEALAADGPTSVDTTKPAVARAAVAAGATLINDVSASLQGVAAETGAGWVAMHRRGDPRTMQRAPRYDDVVGTVREFLAERASAAEAAGVTDVWIDPGIGFGKTAAHNLELLRRLPELVDLGWPVLIGTSRKTFLGKLLAASDGAGEPVDVEDRLAGSIATATWSMVAGARMVRVHDVRATVQAATVVAGQVPAA